MVADIPYDDRDGFIWVDGEMVPWREAKIHILNHGLHYASSVFEGERVYNGHIFKLTEHTERLLESAEMLGFTIPYSVEEIDEACKEVVKKQGVKNGYVRPVAWRGSERMAISSQNSKIHLAIASWEWSSYFAEELHKKGIKLQWSDWRRPSPETIPCKSKAAGLYMICTLSKHKAESEGFHDALMLDWRGYIAEATGANFFMVVDGEIHTPIPDCFLDGITRRTVIELAKERGYKVHERYILPEDIKTAQEIFLTGTAAEITPVGQIGDHQFTPGEVTHQLVEDYQKLVNTAKAG